MGGLGLCDLVSFYFVHCVIIRTVSLAWTEDVISSTFSFTSGLEDIVLNCLNMFLRYSPGNSILRNWETVKFNTQF